MAVKTTVQSQLRSGAPRSIIFAGWLISSCSFLLLTSIVLACLFGPTPLFVSVTGSQSESPATFLATAVLFVWVGASLSGIIGGFLLEKGKVQGRWLATCALVFAIANSLARLNAGGFPEAGLVQGGVAVLLLIEINIRKRSCFSAR